MAGFRTKLLVAMMLVVSAMMGCALYFAEQNLTASVERSLESEFQGELAALHNLQELRRVALVERCRALVRKPRIHAAFEDGALDLLYPSAEDELRDVMQVDDELLAEGRAPALRAQFYRFLNNMGGVIPPANPASVGKLPAAEEAQLALPFVPQKQQLGYLAHAKTKAGGAISEVIAMPVVSTETGEVIAALVLGFKPFEFGRHLGSGIQSGLWVNGELHLGPTSGVLSSTLSTEVMRAMAESGGKETNRRVKIDGEAFLLFSKQLNPDSLFPAAYEVGVFPLAGLQARQWTLRWQVLGLGAVLLLGAYGASHLLAVRLARPVESLAVTSEENRTQRERAEAALETTSEELQRSARFSADASHQLKTPVTVLRAGLEELLTRENLTTAECNEISALIHQTYRLSSLIEDLLLLSRMDAGRLKLEFSSVNLTELVEASFDDLSALPDELDLKVESFVPADLQVAGEKRYTAIILQNLLENARKYNQRGGRIRIAAHEDESDVVLTVGNTGRPITREGREHIFERFHRGVMGENVPGYGLGLNLARELARLHGGDLRLARSDEAWTEFEVRFRPARQVMMVSRESE